jgi:small ligand-binding sensory domain FIST
MQFLLRDAKAAELDLKARLAEVTGAEARPMGALLFTCLARGQHLFGSCGHDSKLFAEAFPGVPVGGSFCSGEIAPLGGRTRVHGFTSVFALFRPAPDAMA